MVSPKFIVPAAALVIALATAAPPAARAATPCCGTKTTPETVASRTLARYTAARKQQEQILAKVNEENLWEGRESGGVRQLHPVRGTSLVPEDYAQQTLGEDWFLNTSLTKKPAATKQVHSERTTTEETATKRTTTDRTTTKAGKTERTTTEETATKRTTTEQTTTQESSQPQTGNAALHLAVPYDADVYVKLASSEQGTEGKWVPVRSRGRYRHLVLTGVPQHARHDVFVRADLWTDDPKCAPKVTRVCKNLQIQAGDRRYVKIDADDFDALAMARTCAFVSLATTVCDAGDAEDLFSFQPVKLNAVVKYKTSDRLQAEYFRFAGSDEELQKLALTVTHKPANAKSKIDKAAEVTITLYFTWQGRKDPVEVKFDKAKPSFDYEHGQPGKAVLKLNGAKIQEMNPDDFRHGIEDGLRKALSKLNRPKDKKITMSGEIKLPSGLTFEIGSPLTITLVDDP